MYLLSFHHQLIAHVNRKGKTRTFAATMLDKPLMRSSMGHSYFKLYCCIRKLGSFFADYIGLTRTFMLPCMIKELGLTKLSLEEMKIMVFNLSVHTIAKRCNIF